MDDIVGKIISDFWYALGALLALTFLLHLFLVYPKNLSKKSWKKIDYIWISLTITGLLSATNTVNASLSLGRRQDAAYRAALTYKDLLKDLSPKENSWVCRTMERDTYSPVNYDDIVADFERTCKWRNDVYKRVDSIDSIDYKEIDINKMPSLYLKTDACLDFKKETFETINEYNNLILQKEEAENSIASSSNESLSFLTPLLLILGFALRLTKISGELRHEK